MLSECLNLKSVIPVFVCRVTPTVHLKILHSPLFKQDILKHCKMKNLLLGFVMKLKFDLFLQMPKCLIYTCVYIITFLTLLPKNNNKTKNKFMSDIVLNYCVWLFGNSSAQSQFKRKIYIAKRCPRATENNAPVVQFLINKNEIYFHCFFVFLFIPAL